MRVRINYGDDGAISWRVFSFKGKARFLTTTPKNQFTNPGPDRINRNQRFSRGLEVFVQTLNDQQLSTLERFIFHCRNYGPDHSS
jgi:hypothetical protein